MVCGVAVRLLEGNKKQQTTKQPKPTPANIRCVGQSKKKTFCTRRMLLALKADSVGLSGSENVADAMKHNKLSTQQLMKHAINETNIETKH